MLNEYLSLIGPIRLKWLSLLGCTMTCKPFHVGQYLNEVWNHKTYHKMLKNLYLLHHQSILYCPSNDSIHTYEGAPQMVCATYLISPSLLVCAWQEYLAHRTPRRPSLYPTSLPSLSWKPCSKNEDAHHIKYWLGTHLEPFSPFTKCKLNLMLWNKIKPSQGIFAPQFVRLNLIFFLREVSYLQSFILHLIVDIDQNLHNAIEYSFQGTMIAVLCQPKRLGWVCCSVNWYLFFITDQVSPLRKNLETHSLHSPH